MENEYVIQVEVPANVIVKRYLKKQGYVLRQPCGGECKCVECLIRVVKGNLDASLKDQMVLPYKALKQGYRLGCQAVTYEPVTIEVRKSQLKKPGEKKPGLFYRLKHRRY